MQELEPGRVIAARYRLDMEIGKGGFGTVWRATQLGVERMVAIKFLRTDLDADARLRFDREARALGMLNHSGCVTLFDFGVTEEGQAFLVTEFVHGESLNAWRRRDHPMSDILEVGCQLAAALAHAHRHQLVHRDLKPANVMVTRDDTGQMRIKVLDFGVARVAGDRWPDITKTGVVIGTPGYMSPEQLIGGELSPKTDLYALGVLLFELVEGGPPFRAETSLKLAMRHIKEDAPQMTRGPKALRELVSALLSRHPDDRPLSARHVHEALQALEASDAERSVGLASDLAVTAQQSMPTTPFSSRRFGSRRPTPAMIALGAVAVIALAGFAITMLQSPDDEEEPRKSGLSQVLNPTVPARPSAAGDAGTRADAASTTTDMPAKPGGFRSAGCGIDRADRGLTKVSAVAGLAERSVDVFIPTNYDPNVPHAAIVLLHDVFETRTQLLDVKGFGPRAEASNVLLILPRDDSIRATWRSSAALEKAKEDTELAMDELCIDRKQVFMFGNATAGSALDQLICRLDIKAAAVAGHRFKHTERLCREGTVVPYLLIHQLDGYEPPEGGDDCLGEERISIDEHDAYLVARNRCDKRRRAWQDGDNECFTWACEADLVSCRATGGRPWTGKPRIPCEGKAGNFPYLETIWQFFFDRDAMFQAPAGEQ